MTDNSKPIPDTLEEVAQQKAEVQRQIRIQKRKMDGLARELFAPLEPATNKAAALTRAFNTGMVVFDGVRLGMKLMRRFRKFFGRK